MIQDGAEVEAQGRQGGKRKKASGFFALDVHQFERVRSSGLGVEEAATYMALLVSTDQSNVTSSGGVNSVMEYTGLTRAEVRKAIGHLEGKRLLAPLSVERKRARAVPRYTLPQHDPRGTLGNMERGVVEGIGAGRQPAGKTELNAAQRAQAKGYIEKRSDGWHILEHANEVAFIPNSFVRVREGDSPLRRLVLQGELGPIMLAAELYKLQNLMDERGVPVSALRAYFYAETETRVGQYRLHRLQPGRTYKDPKSGETLSMASSCNTSRFHDYEQERFWSELRALEAAHVVEWAIYSANGKPSGDRFAFNRPQRPLGALRNGAQRVEAPESIAGLAAYLLHLCAEGALDPTKGLREIIEEWRATSPVIAIENQSVGHVEGIGILRMTHRAATDNSRAWHRQTVEECRQVLFLAEQVARENFPQALGIFQGLQGQQSLGSAISM